MISPYNHSVRDEQNGSDPGEQQEFPYSSVQRHEPTFIHVRNPCILLPSEHILLIFVAFFITIAETGCQLKTNVTGQFRNLLGVGQPEEPNEVGYDGEAEKKVGYIL